MRDVAGGDRSPGGHGSSTASRTANRPGEDREVLKMD